MTAVERVPFVPTSYLAVNAARRPAADAVLDPERTLTFADLDRAVRATAAALDGAGLDADSVVAVQLPNLWEYIVLELAVPLTGRIVLPLPLNLGESELRFAMSSAGAALLVADRALGAAARRIAGQLGMPAVATAQLIPIDADQVAYDDQPSDPDRVVEIALTSGTTGTPKLASLSARLKQATFEGFTSRLEITADDRVLVMSPLMQGIGGMCLYCLRVGAGLIMTRDPRFAAEHVLGLAERFRATLLLGVPTNVIRLLEVANLAGYDLSSCRCTAVAGAPMPPDVAREWEERTGSRVVSFYGSMDAGQLAVGSPSDPPAKRWHTVGRPHDAAECLICDQDGQPLAPGQVGEICMRGPTVQARYWGEEHGPLGPDGWAHMGDLGLIDTDGYLHVSGRLKDIVVRGGTNINPYEVEDAIRTYPGVRDVCVVGRADRELGERAVAYVVGRLTLDELRRYLDECGLAKYKWPEFLELIDEIPLSGPGKVNRKLLKERASAASAVP